MMGRDEIRIEQLEVFAHHGVYPEETEKGQVFFVNAVLYTDTRQAGKRDCLELSTDYGAVCGFITEWMQKNTCQLLEAVAEGLSEAILLKYDLINSIDLEIRKPNAPIPLPFGCVSVKVHRGWHSTYVALGSNMGDREGYIRGAVNALRENPCCRVKKVSELTETKAYGVTDQADFLNGVLEMETLLPPEELLELLHTIENKADRKRTLRWGPRTLDLDILFYEDLVCAEENLTIPHPDMKNREFVLKPLCELAPGLIHPVFRKTAAQMLEELNLSSAVSASYHIPADGA